MTTNNKKTALVTGANSGIGFEASAQLAEAGFACVILACRTGAKAETARGRLIERCGRDIFEVLAVELTEPASVTSACNILVNRGGKIDFLLLNAGMCARAQLVHNAAGVELTFASTLIGHHLLTMRLLAARLLTDHARIVIAGSEAALGNLAGMKIPDFAALANEHYNGDLAAALMAVAQAQPPYKYYWLNSYGAAKRFVVWWAAALARKLPDGQTVNAVSPGTTAQTNFNRHQPWLMRTVIKSIATQIAKRIGMTGPISDAARRYLTAEAFDDETTGHFFASPPGKLVGPLELQTEPDFLNTSYQDACWQVVVRLAGGLDYPE